MNRRLLINGFVIVVFSFLPLVGVLTNKLAQEYPALDEQCLPIYH